MSNDMQKMMRDAQKALAQMQQLQQELASMRIEGSAGGGAVVATCNGQGEFASIKIKKEAVDPEDVETLEDLVLAAVKDATNKVQELVQKRSSSITGGFNLPGMGL